MPAVERAFRVMGCGAVVLVEGPARLLSVAEARLRRLEARWSRFLPGSDISRLNCAGGSPIPVSADTLDVLEAALAGWRLTAGRFDPTVLPALEAAGFGPPRQEPANPGPPPPLPSGVAHPGGAAPGLGGLALDRPRRRAALAPGVRIDLGGIGKGFAADVAAGELLAAGASRALVGVGGDLRVAGPGPDPAGWVIAVEAPGDPGRELVRLAVERGGVATTSPLGRGAPAHAGGAHHLIDPAAGAPSRSALRQVTVLAADAARAEILAKAAYLSGDADEALAFVEARGGEALVVDRAGRLRPSPSLSERLL
ncbi:MAG: FAD:protein FMN transferase [Acidimicrobiales bacterium]